MEAIETQRAPETPTVKQVRLDEYLRVGHESGGKRLSPQQHRTLTLLLGGDSEKQIAYKMKISRATVHGYVKALYRLFDVHSRSELMATYLRHLEC